MTIHGTFHAIDNSHVTFFSDLNGPAGAFQATDNPHQTFFSGYVVSDTTVFGTDQTFFEGQILGIGDLTLTLADWTYAGGYQLDATTYTGGTWGYRYYNPIWINYSIWYQSYDGTNYDTSAPYAMVGYRDREPVNYPTVGSYYAAMVVPSPPGHYEIRWRYQKTASSYAKEIDVPFVSLSRGIDSMPDYSLPAAPVNDTTFVCFGVDPGVDIVGLFDDSLDIGTWNSVPSIPAGF
jgi:hypothetical protein